MDARPRHGRHMVRSSTALVAVVALLLALGLAAPSVAARGGNTPVRGIVIGVSIDSLEVQRDDGPVTVELTNETKVIRTVSGTVADLRRGQIVELVLNQSSGRVTALHIRLPGTKLANPPAGRGRGRRLPAARGPALVRAVTRTTIRVRYANGKLATFRLGGRPRVIKDVAGRVVDIAIGQTVLVTRSHGGRVAETVVILTG